MPQLCGEASLVSKQTDCRPKPCSLCISEDPRKTRFELRGPCAFCCGPLASLGTQPSCENSDRWQRGDTGQSQRRGKLSPRAPPAKPHPQGRGSNGTCPPRPVPDPSSTIPRMSHELGDSSQVILHNSAWNAPESSLLEESRGAWQQSPSPPHTSPSTGSTLSKPGALQSYRT